MTSKQQIVARDLLENTGKSVSKAMLDAGYAPTSAKNPQQLTRSKAWQKLMEDYLPDEKLIEKHKNLLEADKFDKLVFPYILPDKAVKDFTDFLTQLGVSTSSFSIATGGKRTVIYFTGPDRSTQLSALALAYKIKGRLSPNLFVSGEKVIAILNGASSNSSKYDNP